MKASDSGTLERSKRFGARKPSQIYRESDGMPTLFLGIQLGTFCRIGEVEITGRRSRRLPKALASAG
jgi:hypothetical protein